MIRESPERMRSMGRTRMGKTKILGVGVGESGRRGRGIRVGNLFVHHPLVAVDVLVVNLLVVVVVRYGLDLVTALKSEKRSLQAAAIT